MAFRQKQLWILEELVHLPQTVIVSKYSSAAYPRAVRTGKLFIIST